MPEWFWYTSFDRNPLFKHLVTVNMMYSSGTLGDNVEVTEADFRALARGRQEFVQIIAKKTRHPCRSDLPGRTETRRRCQHREPQAVKKLKTVPTGNPLSFMVQSILYFLYCSALAFALVPRFQRNEEETVVASVGQS